MSENQRLLTKVNFGRRSRLRKFPNVPEAPGRAAAPHKMADGEEVTLDGRPLQALRVADLKAALEQRGLVKSGQKSALIKRLRGVRKRPRRKGPRGPGCLAHAQTVSPDSFRLSDGAPGPGVRIGSAHARGSRPLLTPRERGGAGGGRQAMWIPTGCTNGCGEEGSVRTIGGPGVPPVTSLWGFPVGGGGAPFRSAAKMREVQTLLLLLLRPGNSLLSPASGDSSGPALSSPAPVSPPLLLLRFATRTALRPGSRRLSC